MEQGEWAPDTKATRKCVSGMLVKGMSTILVGNNTAACKDGNGVETPSGWRYASICRLTKRDAARSLKKEFEERARQHRALRLRCEDALVGHGRLAHVQGLHH